MGDGELGFVVVAYGGVAVEGVGEFAGELCEEACGDQGGRGCVDAGFALPAGKSDCDYAEGGGGGEEFGRASGGEVVGVAVRGAFGVGCGGGGGFFGGFRLHGWLLS